MKQTLQLKLTQHLTLTPQLQQSIRLLQLSTLELNAEVDRMLQENPLLEREDGDDDVPPPEYPLAGTAPGPVTTERVARDEGERERDRDNEGDGDGGDGMQGADAAPTRDDLPDVTDFSDYGGGGTDGDWGGGSGSSNEEDDFSPQQIATSSLRDHLMGQLALLNLPLRD
ncbi:MAG TPA: RNA polymerase factor sigma-54, partial [Casimicrobiaceae bacterium]